MTTRSLETTRVLITRPGNRGAGLAAAVAAGGGEPLVFPVIAIEPGGSDQLLRPGGLDLADHALAIFISVPAVESLVRILGEPAVFPAQLPVAAIGPATAAALEAGGIRVRYLPRNGHDSEGLLAELESLPLDGSNVVLYRGQQGRELLEERLAERGARVHAVESYRRVPAADPPMENLARWLEDDNAVLTLTSVAILDALVDVTPEERQADLRRHPVVALSDRIAKACRERGFSGPVKVALDTGDNDMLEAISEVRGGGCREK